MDENYIKKKLQSQDKIVFDYVFTYYYSGLCAFVNHFVHDRDVSEDLVQDFFVHFWIDCPKIEISGSLKSYFFSAVKNKTSDYFKHVKVKNHYKDHILSKQVVKTEASEYAEVELMALIKKGLKKLQPRCREIFVLSRFNGKSNKEISEFFKISQRTVELQISNALKILRIELADF
ncbi:MAG: RNA polymerase sigma-70 factor [Bacteroidales bacterium]|nr:RNA polymerase sigma-70 factor [Bacteroidales bacterium]